VCILSVENVEARLNRFAGNDNPAHYPSPQLMMGFAEMFRQQAPTKAIHDIP
jgi:hypothetical protein